MAGRYGGPFHPWKPLAHATITLPQALREAGYATQLIHDTPHLVNGGHNFDWPFNAWTFIRGAEVDRSWIDGSMELPENWAHDPLFDFVEGGPPSASWLTYARANRERERDEDWSCAKVFLTAAKWVRANRARDRFLLWVDCFDPHEPWDVPPHFAKLYDDDPDWDGRVDPRSFRVGDASRAPERARKRISAQYAGKVSWMDRWLGELLDALDETGLSRNTAVLLTSDHGTNLGEWGRFGKGVSVRELEAHVPFILRLPGDEGGRSSVIVQPQDIFATLAGIAGVQAPDDIESFDVLKAAREQGPGDREVALAGSAASPAWATGGDGGILFTVIDAEWYLGFTVAPEESFLTRFGSFDNVAAEYPEVVERLRAAGLTEIARRGIDPALMHWLRSEGQADFPSEVSYWEGYPGPDGFRPYWTNLYREEAK